MDTSSRIFSLLELRGLEQKEFAAQIGVHAATITDWKSGKSKSYTKYLPQIAKALNTTVEYLLPELETKKEPTVLDDELSAFKFLFEHSPQEARQEVLQDVKFLLSLDPSQLKELARYARFRFEIE